MRARVDPAKGARARRLSASRHAAGGPIPPITGICSCHQESQGRKVCYEVCSPISPDSGGRGSRRQRDRHCTICAAPSRHPYQRSSWRRTVQPLALEPQPPLLTVLLNSPLALLGPAATLGTLPPPPAPTQFAIAPNLADTIDSIYIAVEPWVQYGFEVATAVVRWVPYVGWFAGLIMDGYFFGESLVPSGVFNFTDWLRGDGGVVENLVDFGVDVGLAFVWLGIDELNTFIPLPPFCRYRRGRRCKVRSSPSSRPRSSRPSLRQMGNRSLQHRPAAAASRPRLHAG